MEHGEGPKTPPRGWLEHEITAWTQEGLIKKEQGRWILARYGYAQAETARSLKQLTFVQIVTALGALLIGVGVLIMMGANWEILPRYIRMGMLLVLTAGAYAGGYHLAFGKGNYPGVGKALIFLGSLFWGTSIFLVSQMYHISDSASGASEYFTGVLYWFIGTLPLAYVLRSPLQLALSLVLGSIWLIGRWMDLYEPWVSPIQLMILLVGVGTCIYVVGSLHTESHTADGHLGDTHRKFGVAFLTVGFFVLSFRDVWSTLSRTAEFYIPGRVQPTVPPLTWLAPFIVVGILGAGWMLLNGRNRERSCTIEASACLVFAILASLMAALVYTVGPTGITTAGTMWLAVIFNLLLLGAELGFVWLGWQSMNAGLINWGLTVFMFHLLARYFDVLGEMLNGGAGFVGAGLLVILGGVFLERQRRGLMRTMPGRELS